MDDKKQTETPEEKKLRQYCKMCKLAADYHWAAVCFADSCPTSNMEPSRDGGRICFVDDRIPHS